MDRYVVVEVVAADYDIKFDLWPNRKRLPSTKGYCSRKGESFGECNGGLLDCELPITHRIITFHICCSKLILAYVQAVYISPASGCGIAHKIKLASIFTVSPRCPIMLSPMLSFLNGTLINDISPFRWPSCTLVIAFSYQDMI